MDLLGCDLYDLFVADLDGNGVPQTARFTAIYDAFCIDIEGTSFNFKWSYDYYNYYCQNRQNKSRGILAMLRGFMFFEYTRDQPQLNSSIGTSTSKGVASDLKTPNQTALKKQYNKSILDYWNIQFFICENESDYPEYNGLRKGSVTII